MAAAKPSWVVAVVPMLLMLMKVTESLASFCGMCCGYHMSTHKQFEGRRWRNNEIFIRS